MISPIGNDIRQKGFSFLEVMVVVMILSGGLVLIYKSFFMALDYTNYLTARLQANILLDEKIAELNRRLLDQNQLVLVAPSALDRVMIANRPIDFQYTLDFRAVKDWQGLFLLDITINWREGSRHVHLSRQVYLFNPKLVL